MRALITGANRGLGLETARQLADRGWAVTLTSRNEADGAAAAQRLADAGHDARFHRLDVTDAASIAELAAALQRDRTALDVLVNNAGIYQDGRGADPARRTLDTNFFGPLRLTEALLPCLPDGGNVVMVSSGLGELSHWPPPLRDRLLDPRLTQGDLVAMLETYVRDAGSRGSREDWPQSAYGVSKAGLNALVRVLARDLAPRRIRVNAVCPGWVRTDMGGASASRSVETGAGSIVWAAVQGADGPNGGFFRDGRAISW